MAAVMESPVLGDGAYFAFLLDQVAPDPVQAALSHIPGKRHAHGLFEQTGKLGAPHAGRFRRSPQREGAGEIGRDIFHRLQNPAGGQVLLGG